MSSKLEDELKTYLVTGGSGFIGSNFIQALLTSEPEAKVVNLDKLTYAASESNVLSGVDPATLQTRYELVHGDICDRALVQSLFSKHGLDGVYHLAAESHVDNSISGPSIFVETNVVGTFNLLQCAYQAWMESPKKVRNGFEPCRFLHVSTDEVYGSLGPSGEFTESTPYAPNSPYSATKAGSDFLVRSYFHTFGLNVVTTNCSNNYGPKQHAEKLIPTIIRKALAGEQIPIYGQGLNVRDWLYVGDHCTALTAVFARGRAGETYNIGSRNERKNIDIATLICEILNDTVPNSKIGDYRKLMTFVEDRPGHDLRYAIDPTKIENEIGWQARESFMSGLKKTISWYLQNQVGDRA